MKKKNTALLILLAVLVIALVAVGGYIAYKQFQYGVSDAYYDSLRSALGRFA